MHMLAISRLLMMRAKMYRLMRAKNIAQKIAQKGKPYISYLDRFHYWNAKFLHCGCIKTHFRVNRDKPYIIKLFKIYVTMTTAGTFPHFILTAIMGFIGGIMLSYAYFFMSAVVLDMSTYSAFYVSAILCIFLTIGMAFFEGVRCIVMSVLPETCTSRARAMLISIALFLLISGPGSNILFNTRQLTDTIACTQEQVGAIGHNLTELYKKPMRIVKHGIGFLIKSIKPVIDKLKRIITLIKTALLTIGKTIRKVFSWLKVFKINCHTNGGTPGDLCAKSVEKFLRSCEATFPKGLCNPFEILTWLCLPFKTIAAICAVKNFIDDHIFNFLKNKIKDLIRFLRTIFYVKVSFHHSYSFKTNQSRSLRDVYKGVHESQKKRLEFFLGIIHFMKFVLGMYIAYVLITAFIYRYRFFYQTRYDNRHINQFLIDLDTKRATVNRQTLFPLTASERKTYVALSSLRLTSMEFQSLLKGSVYLIVACLKTSFIFLIDLFLFFILDLVHNHGRISFYFGRDKSVLGAEGSGFFYTLYNLFNNLFNVFDIELRFDTGPCLPQAIPVDYLVYQRIAVTMGFAWVMSILQPFALRFRSYVLSNYYPHIARRRAVWLYNHILQTRGVFSQYVRRTLFTRGAIGLRSEKPDPYKWLITRFPRLYFFLPFRNLFKECMVCGYKNPTIRCATPECTGTYDKECFEIINYICLLCNMPQNFKGLDVSEEEDSDGEITQSRTPPKSQQPNPWWKFWIQVSRSDSPIEMEEGNIGIPDDLSRPLSSRLGQPSTSSQQTESSSKDYFGDEWRRDDWASLDDFEIPNPDMGSWTRPHFTTTIKTPLSTRE